MRPGQSRLAGGALGSSWAVPRDTELAAAVATAHGPWSGLRWSWLFPLVTPYTARLLGACAPWGLSPRPGSVDLAHLRWVGMQMAVMGQFLRAIRAGLGSTSLGPGRPRDDAPCAAGPPVAPWLSGWEARWPFPWVCSCSLLGVGPCVSVAGLLGGAVWFVASSGVRTDALRLRDCASGRTGAPRALRGVRSLGRPGRSGARWPSPWVCGMQFARGGVSSCWLGGFVGTVKIRRSLGMRLHLARERRRRPAYDWSWDG